MIVAEAEDTVLREALPKGAYVVQARRVPGEAPVEHDVQITPNSITLLCLDLTPGGGLCEGSSVDSRPITQEERCP